MPAGYYSVTQPLKTAPESLKMEQKASGVSGSTKNSARRHIRFRNVDKSRKKASYGGIGGGDPPLQKENDSSYKTKLGMRDFRARYWSYLFENFHRAVDEIYCVCEADESELECQEMIMMLEVCKKDFEALIKRFEMQCEYLKEGGMAGGSRNVAWEVRKSPSKGHSTFETYLAKQQQRQKKLDKPRSNPVSSNHNAISIKSQPSSKTVSVSSSTPVDHQSSSSNIIKPSSSCGSWADKVRGYSIQHESERKDQLAITNHKKSPSENGITTSTINKPSSDSQSVTVTQVSLPLEDSEEPIVTSSNGSNNHGDNDHGDNGNHGDSGNHGDNDCHSNTGHHGDSVDRGDTDDCNDNGSHGDSNAHGSKGMSYADSTSGFETTSIEYDTNNNVLQPISEQPQHCISTELPPTATTEATPTNSDSWKDMMDQYDEEKEKRGNIAWADLCDSPPLVDEEFEELVNMRETRSPGRAVQLHQKLSSPLRKKSGEHSIKTLEEKQVKAEMFRVKKKEEIAIKSKNLSDKIREVQQSRDTITIQKKEAMEERLERAEKLRESHLLEKIRKAQEEDMKVNEIAFINSLEAQNKKIEVLERHQGVEARLQDMQEERQRKIEENQAKEEAAQERRKALEAERKVKLQERNQKRKEQDAKFQMNKLEKEKAREEAAKERERKIEARQAAMLHSAEELEKKIQMKHDNSSRRYDQQIEHKKERALFGIASRHSSTDYAPCVEAYQKKKWCNVCNVKIVSEVYLMSHLKGRKHRDSLLANGLSEEQNDIIVLAPENIQKQTVTSEVEERMKTGKKRAKKLRQKMSGRSRESETLLQSLIESGTSEKPSRHSQRFTKLIKSLNRCLDSSGDTLVTHLTNIEKTLAELNRILTSKNKEDQSSFCIQGGVTSLSRLLLIYSDPACLPTQGKSQQFFLPLKPLLLALTALELTCTSSLTNSLYMILSNKIVPLVDLAYHYFSFSDILKSSFKATPTPYATECSTASCKFIDGSPSQSPSFEKSLVNLCGSLFNVIAVVMSSVVIGKSLEANAVKDCVSYVVSVGLIDKLAEYFRSVTGPIEETSTAHLIISGLNMLLALMALLHTEVEDVFDPKPQDHTHIIAVLRQTELAGILSLLYALLLHDGPPRHSSIPPTLPPYVLSISAAGIRTINNSLMVGLKVIQNCLGAEGISLEFRHVLGYLLWYCSHHQHVPLLHELILAIGYFSVLHTENQMFLLAGRSPTLLKLLCGLPFEYFSNPKFEDILFPTLVSSCYNVPAGKDVLKLEINCKLIHCYLKNKIDKKQTKKDETRDFFSLRRRFPESHWKAALDFFFEDS